MPIQWMELARLIATFFGGGLAGAFVNEAFRRRAGKTRDVHLVERVNRRQDELRGIRFVRSASGGPEREVKNVRSYQMTLRNTSAIHLRNLEVQFEFSSEDVEPWVSRPARSKTALLPVDALPAHPWKKALRWKVPSLPANDYIEFSFQVIEPTTEDYEAVIYSDANIVLRRVASEPEEFRPWFFVPRHLALATVLAVVAFLVSHSILGLSEVPPSKLLEQATAALEQAEKAPSDHERQEKLEKAVRLLIKVIKDMPPENPSGG